MSDDKAFVSPRTGARWIPVIGLEVHAQLKTRTKLFCGCANTFGEEPNSFVCPVCTGQPGAMPVLNREAVELAVRAALALDATVAERSKFDRKNYFYCDLPKGYQISQYDQPFCQGGGIELPSGKRVRLNRIHMEEDAGKAIHDRGSVTLVDLNRAGVPLIESVTEADMQSAEEAYQYLTALKEILRYAGVSDCDMEKGSLRCDVNVSVHPEGEPWRTKVEIKNLNSFRNVQASIDYEISRQTAAYESGETERFPVQETRLFDPDSGKTRTMRAKENESDYRYFPEPDLPPVYVDDAFRERQRGFLPELPAARRERYQSELGLSEYDAGVLASAREVADFFEAALRAGAPAKGAANWIQNDILRGLSDPEIPSSTIDEMPLRPHQLAEVIALVDAGTVHKGGARQVVDTLLREPGEVEAIVESKGLRQVRDEGQIEGWCREALQGNDDIIADVKAGKVKALGALVGPVMRASSGSANPKLVQQVLARLIAEEY